MLSPQQTRRAQKIGILIGLGLTAYYFLVFHPLAQRAEAADQPLRSAWEQLTKARIHGDTRLDLNEMDRQIRKAKGALAALDRAEQKVQASVASDSAARLKNREPFQLVD